MELHAQDFTRYAVTAEPADAVFISPPWGGIGHLERDHFSLQSVDGCDIVRLQLSPSLSSPWRVLVPLLRTPRSHIPDSTGA